MYVRIHTARTTVMATKKRWPDPRQNIRFEQKTGYPSNLHAASSKISDVHKKFMMVEKKGAPYKEG